MNIFFQEANLKENSIQVSKSQTKLPSIFKFKFAFNSPNSFLILHLQTPPSAGCGFCNENEAYCKNCFFLCEVVHQKIGAEAKCTEKQI